MTKLLKAAFFALIITSLTVGDSYAQRGKGGGGEGGGGRGGRGGEAGGGEGGGGRGGRGGETGGGGAPSRTGSTSRTGGMSRGGSTGGGFDMSAMAGRYDSNGDGKIEPAEFQKIPERFRGMLEQNGITVNRTVSVGDFGSMVSQGFQKMREQRMSGTEDRGRGGDERSRGGDERKSAGTNGQPVPAALFKMPERIKVIRELSETLKTVDVDQDGMIALYEWTEADKPFEDFYLFDKNDDGFITAQEEAGDLQVDATRFKSERLSIITSTSTVKNASGKLSFSDSPGSGGRGVSQYSKPEDVERGKSTFKSLDKNGDGRLSSDEWDKSGRVKSWFESSNVKLTEMDSDAFTQAYGKLVAKYRESSANKSAKKSEKRR